VTGERLHGTGEETDMQVAITGSSGLIGNALAQALQGDGHRVIAMVRREPRAGRDEIRWDPAAGTIDRTSLEGLDAVVHLAGAGIGDERWTPAYRRLVLESRTSSTGLLAETLPSLQRPPRVFVSASGIGYYGDRGDEVLTEESEPGDLFLSEVCKEWEAAARPAAEAGMRVPIIRTGVVLSAEGGALPRLLPLFKLGVGGRMGSGRQWWSWISIDDEVGAIRWLLEPTNDVTGPVNLTAPGTTTNAEFTKVLAGVLHRPALLPVPAFGPRLLKGRELADELLFAGQRVEPSVLARSGFRFEHPDLESALRAVLDKPERDGRKEQAA
jgi:uncharacterized protein